MPSPSRANQQTISQAGELKQFFRKQNNPDGVYSGMTKRLAMVDGTFVDPKIRGPKASKNTLNHLPLSKNVR